MELTQEQRAAVESNGSDILVIAGAGSGKTRVLAARIAWLLDHGSSPSDMLVLTFTRKSAGELIARLEQQLGENTLKGALIGTFHSVALSILRAEGHLLGYEPESMTILEPEDADQLLKAAASDLGYLRTDDKGKDIWKSPLSMSRVSQYREAIYTGQDASLCAEADTARKIFKAYQNRMREMNALDFGAILQETNRLFVEHDDALARYIDRVKHVLVDELQDSDAVQYNLHDHFRALATFFGVGDVRQSIYGFRGARPDYMVERHPHATVHNLTACFRCGSAIVEAANKLIDHNHEPLCEPMKAVEECGAGSVRVMRGRSADIITEAQLLQDAGYAPSDIVILARSHRTLRRLHDVASELKVPVHRVGARFDVCSTEIFRAKHAALRYAINRRDRVAKWTLEKYYSPQEVAQRSYQDGPEIFRDMTIEGFITSYPGVRDEVDWFWLNNCGPMTIPDALRWFAFRDSQDDVIPEGKISMMTVHAAKGLEWPVVIVAGLNEGDFPGRAVREEGGILEERRLAYVAMTRAKERLVLCYRSEEDQAEGLTVSAPSRFIRECGA